MMAPPPPALADVYCSFTNEELATEIPDGSNEIEWQVRYNNGNWTTLPGTDPTRSFLFNNINGDGTNTLIEFRLRGLISGDPNTDWSEIVATQVRPEALPNIFGVDVFPACNLFPKNRGSVFISASAINPLTYTLSGTTEDDEVYTDENDTGRFPDLPNGVYQVSVDDGDGLCVAMTEELTIAGADAGAMDVFHQTGFNCTTQEWRIEVIGSSSFGEGLGYSLDGEAYQSDPTFSGLPGGEYTVYSIDTVNCATDTTLLSLVSPNLEIVNIIQPECPSTPFSTVELRTTPVQDFPFYTLFRGDQQVATSDDNFFFDLVPGTYRVETLIEDCLFSEEFTIAYERPNFSFEITQVSGGCAGEPFIVRVDPTAADGNAYDYEFSF
ncbi:MAG: hypothetical protein AAFZ52_18120, partial [Bacteroidota bacterium]